jgi:hypothetical protein
MRWPKPIRGCDLYLAWAAIEMTKDALRQTSLQQN